VEAMDCPMCYSREGLVASRGFWASSCSHNQAAIT